MRLTVNGTIRELSKVTRACTIDDVLLVLCVRKEIVAVAQGDTIVPRSHWGETLVSEGECIEIVHFVGGGSDF
jgi:thiamine biosynthesis protein ThiS